MKLFPHNSAVVVTVFVLLLSGCYSAGSAAHRRKSAQPAVALAARPVVVTARTYLLEVHVRPNRALGAATLSVNGTGIRSSPASFGFKDLKPFPPPQRSTTRPNPYPLPRMVIRIFRIHISSAQDHRVTILLRWAGGHTSLTVVLPASKSKERTH